VTVANRFSRAGGRYYSVSEQELRPVLRAHFDVVPEELAAIAAKAT